MLSEQDKKTLLTVARDSIEHGLDANQPLKVISAEYSHSLQENGAAFVTLTIKQQLRGCIGSLQAYQPLVKDVAEHAFDAAFKDPRFSPLSIAEFDAVHIHIEVLNPSQPIHFNSEQDLLNQLQPGVDGLILSENFHKGTFLPTVWESLPVPEDFLAHLKQKAGLPKNYWSDSIKIERYSTEGFSE